MSARVMTVLMILVLSCTARISPADEAADVRESAISFARALALGNSEQAKKFAVNNEMTISFIELVAPLASAETKLHDAALSRFGDKGAAITNGGTPAEVFNEKYSKDPANLQVNITGDTAAITAKPKEGQKNPSNESLFLKKVDGAWKVDVAALPGVETMNQKAPQLKAVTRAMSETAEEIQAGKYPDVTKAKVALAQKVMAALPPSGTARNASSKAK